jgi:hypothetical protein
MGFIMLPKLSYNTTTGIPVSTQMSKIKEDAKEGLNLPAMTSEMSTSLREPVWAMKASATTSADPSEPPKLFVLSLICMKE